MANLVNKRVAITSSRKLNDIQKLIEKRGGVAVPRPIQKTVKCSFSEMEEDLKHFVQKGSDWVVLTTGIGTLTLFEAAEHFQLKELLLKRFSEAKVAVRGYKTVQVLKAFGITPDVVDDDGTNEGLLRALQSYSFSNQQVFIQLHGEPVPRLTNFIIQNGANVREILPYKTVVPNPDVVLQLVSEIIAREVHAVTFTAAPQVRVLFRTAEERGVLSQLINAFNREVVALAVGKVTGSELSERGIQRVIMPEHERMGAMIVELDQFFGKEPFIDRSK